MGNLSFLRWTLIATPTHFRNKSADRPRYVNALLSFYLPSHKLNSKTNFIFNSVCFICMIQFFICVIFCFICKIVRFLMNRGFNWRIGFIAARPDPVIPQIASFSSNLHTSTKLQACTSSRLSQCFCFLSISTLN